jgi:hypothetical protein
MGFNILIHSQLARGERTSFFFNNIHHFTLLKKKKKKKGKERGQIRKAMVVGGLYASSTTCEHIRTRFDKARLGINSFIKRTELEHFLKLI